MIAFAMVRGDCVCVCFAPNSRRLASRYIGKFATSNGPNMYSYVVCVCVCAKRVNRRMNGAAVKKTFDENVNEPTFEDKRRTLGRMCFTF